MSVEKMRTAERILHANCVCESERVNLVLCVRFECVCVRSPGERASTEWF